MDLTADSLLELMEKWNEYLTGIYKQVCERYDLNEDEKRELKIYVFSSRNTAELYDNLLEFLILFRKILI